MGGLWWHCLEVVTMTTGGSFEASSVLILKLVPESSEASKPSEPSYASKRRATYTAT
jgi:hypothetical protein